MATWHKTATWLLIASAIIASKASAQSLPENPAGGATFDCSDARLKQAFDWAKTQALSYAHEGDPVGSWYEAALPNREAFCMRDVSHQAMGAHALGLQGHTLNMLRKFAASISDPRDWCGYWEINRYDKPAPVDYSNDEEFWYNLPANFDVLHACWRMYLWTHDRTYLDDPAFVEFYRRSMTDYVARWDLSPEKAATRERFMNTDKQSPQMSRGIPSYHEGRPGQTRLGVDLPAFQVAAYRAYANILRLQGNADDAKVFEAGAAEVERFIEERFWSQASGRFNELLLTDGSYMVDGDMRAFVLYAGATTSPAKIAKTVESLVHGGSVNIEMGSYYPEIFYRYGAHEAAYRKILELSDPQTPRREYPEVSFAVVGAIVSGLMGISPAEAEGRIATLPRLAEPLSYARIRSLPVHGNTIDVRHNGRAETMLTNRSGKTLTWVAGFYGTGSIDVEGIASIGKPGNDESGRAFVWAEIPVPAGLSKTARLKTE